MNKQKIASFVKTVTGVASSTGVGFIVANAVAATTPPGTKALAKLCINVASAGIAGVVATKVTLFTDVAIDAAFSVTDPSKTDTIVVNETKGEDTAKDSE